MKNSFFILISVFLLLFYSGCNKDSGSGGGTDPFGGGTGGGTGNVTFQVKVVQDQQQQNWFEFTPSTSVTVNSIAVNCAAAGVNNEQVQGDETTVFSNTSPCYIGPINVTLQSGHQWTFTITGKIGSQTGQAYSSNAGYTVP